MADANFSRKSVKELQKYLKERSVTFSDLWKAELVEICEAADRLGIDVDPDGRIIWSSRPRYWYYQYCNIYNTGITSIIIFTILEIPVL